MKAISKVVATAAAGALALCLVGCGGGGGSTQTTTNSDQATQYEASEINAGEITVSESGYSVTTTTTVDADGNTVEVPSINFAFTATNPNAGYVAQNVPFNVTGTNAAGEVVFSGGATCMYMYPGIETALSGTTSINDTEGLDTTVTDFIVQPLTSTVEYIKTSLTDADIEKMFTVKSSEVTQSDPGITVNATVTGDLAFADKIYKIADLEGTLEGHCIAIFYNDSGDIVYGSENCNVLVDENTINSVNDTDAPLNNVSISVPYPPEYSTFKVFVMPGL